jgi:hypothetical protein
VIAMPEVRRTAIAEFKRAMKWIAVIAILMVIGALTYLKLFSTLDAATVIATTLGVFFSVLLGCGLFAAAFFSDKSGLDQEVTDVTKSERTHVPRAKHLPRSIQRNLP